MYNTIWKFKLPPGKPAEGYVDLQVPVKSRFLKLDMDAQNRPSIWMMVNSACETLQPLRVFYSKTGQPLPEGWDDPGLEYIGFYIDQSSDPYHRGQSIWHLWVEPRHMHDY